MANIQIKKVLVYCAVVLIFGSSSLAVSAKTGHKNHHAADETTTYLDHVQSDLDNRLKKIDSEVMAHKCLVFDSVESDLNEWTSTKKEQSKSEINIFKQEYLTEIDAHVTESLKKDIFNEYQEEKKKEIDTKLDETIESILSE